MVIDTFTTAAELSCNVSQVPMHGLVMYKWIVVSSGQTLQPSGIYEKYEVRTEAINFQTQSLALKILDLNHSDAGEYICGAVEDASGNDMSDAVNGTVWLILQGESCLVTC